jgi:hypothetical protein
MSRPLSQVSLPARYDSSSEKGPVAVMLLMNWTQCYRLWNTTQHFKLSFQSRTSKWKGWNFVTDDIQKQPKLKLYVLVTVTTCLRGSEMWISKEPIT